MYCLQLSLTNSFKTNIKLSAMVNISDFHNCAQYTPYTILCLPLKKYFNKKIST